MWQEISPEEKKGYDDRAAASKEQYEKDMAVYRNHPMVKKFEKASGATKRKPKQKAVGRFVSGGRCRGRGGVVE
eukprot:2886831-Pyramimonas_sp.AAC.1